MKISKIETLHCDAGWRNYSFVKVTTSDGVVGWSEYQESVRSPGLTDAINHFGKRAIGHDVGAHERVIAELYCLTRPTAGGVVGQALGALENALLDAKARTLGVPCYELLGGKVRDRVPVYWSHCATFRIERPEYYGVVDTLDDVKAAGAEVREKGMTALKTNVFRHENGKMHGWAQGFGNPFSPQLNVDRKVLNGAHDYLEALRDGAGPDIDIMLDLNFNAKTEGFLQLLRHLSDIGLAWAEIDSYNAPALAYIRQHSPTSIASCEALVGGRAFLPFLQAQAVDVAIIDAVWNGMWNSMKIANLCDAFEVNVAVHNLYGHLATLMNVHFMAAVTNMRIMETDIDRIAWDDELFTVAPVLEDSAFIVPETPGWGTEPDEAGLAKYPAKQR